jgi:hypothetical protein
MKNKIVLNELGDKGRYIDLSGYANDVTITGRHQGDRIVISNASGKVLRFDTVQIHCTRTEPDGDALVFDGALTDCKIIGTGCHIEHGGLTFWGKLENVTVAGLDIYHANMPGSGQAGTFRTGMYLSKIAASFRPNGRASTWGRRICKKRKARAWRLPKTIFCVVGGMPSR